MLDSPNNYSEPSWETKVAVLGFVRGTASLQEGKVEMQRGGGKKSLCFNRKDINKGKALTQLEGKELEALIGKPAPILHSDFGLCLLWFSFFSP